MISFIIMTCKIGLGHETSMAETETLAFRDRDETVDTSRDRLETETTTVLWPFSRTTRVTWCQKRTSGLGCKGRLTEADTPTIQLGATPSVLTSAHLHHPPIFYRLDALPAAQQPTPTVSKHWRQLARLDKGEDTRVLFSTVLPAPSPYRSLQTISLIILHSVKEINNLAQFLSQVLLTHWPRFNGILNITVDANY